MRIFGAALLAVTLGLVGTTTPVSAAPSASAADREATSTIDPTTLATGPAPAVPWLEIDTQTGRRDRLHQPGRRSLTVPTRESSTLLHVRGGYVVAADGTAYFVGPTGKRRVLGSGLAPVLASEAGNWVVLSDDFRRIRVVRTSDGRRVGGRVVANGWAEVVAAGDGKVLLSLGKILDHPRRVVYRTVLWDVERDTTSTVANRRSTAASFRAHRVAVTVGHRQLVLDLRTRKVLWGTPTVASRPHEEAILFSPDDKRVLTTSSSGDDADGQDCCQEVHSFLRVRDARSGRLLTTIRGHFATDNQAAAYNPVWESATRFLVLAGNDVRSVPEAGDEGIWFDRTVIRCSATSARCVKVPIGIDDRLLERKSN